MKIVYAYMYLRKQFSEIDSEVLRGKLIESLRKKGHEVKVIGYDNRKDWNIEGFKQGPMNLMNEIKDTDVFIGEMSSPSQTLGFLLAYSIQHGKPSLYFYPEDSQGKPAGPVFFNPSRLLSVRAYTNDNFERLVESFLRKAQKQLRSDRTTFVTTRYINDFLKWKTRKTGLSKGEVIRGILESSIEEDEEYQKKQ